MTSQSDWRATSATRNPAGGRSGVDAAVTNDEQLSLIVINDGHQGLDRGARADGGLYLGGTELLSVLLAGGEVSLCLLVTRMVTESWRRVLEACSWFS